MTKPKLPWLKMAVYFPFCLFNIGAGLFLCLLPWLFLIGLPLLVLAAMPYVGWLSKHIHAQVAYAERDKPLLEDGELPWEQTGDAATEAKIIDIMINRNGRGRGSQ